MNAFKSWAGAGASLMSIVLASCSGMRSVEHSSVPEVPPPAAATETPPPPEPPAESNPVPSNSDAVRPDTNPQSGPCSCAEIKAKPKIKPKPRHVPKEAPPRLPTAPLVASTSQDGIVDAQVKPINVSVMSILGKRVEGPNKEDMGRVVDVLADASGRVRVAIIDFGGFLGVGDHRIAVDWPLLRFNPDGGDTTLLLSVSREKLKTAPEYKDNPRPQTLTEPTAPPPSPPPAEGTK